MIDALSQISQQPIHDSFMSMSHVDIMGTEENPDQRRKNVMQCYGVGVFFRCIFIMLTDAVQNTNRRD